MEIRLIRELINILLVPRCHVAELMLYSLFIKHFVHGVVCVFLCMLPWHFGRGGG